MMAPIEIATVAITALETPPNSEDPNLLGRSRSVAKLSTTESSASLNSRSKRVVIRPMRFASIFSDSTATPAVTKSASVDCSSCSGCSGLVNPLRRTASRSASRSTSPPVT